MSSTRNKRKRTENDLTSGTRRRTRDAADDDVPAAVSPKNEADGSKQADDSTSVADATTDPISTSNIASITPSSGQGVSQAEGAVADAEADSTSQNLSSRVPLHTENMEPSNTSTEDPDPDSRSSKIRALITHRTILLSRIRLCRNAAEKRLSVTKANETSDEQEIQTHLHMSRLASQAARKARGDDAPTSEKRTSLSLRRGSGVGKRMNAALSSLAPGSGMAMNAASTVPVSEIDSVSPEKTFLSKPPIVGVITPAANPAEVRSSDPVSAAQSVPPPSGPKAATQALQRQNSATALNRPSSGKSLKSNAAPTFIPRTGPPAKDLVKPRIPQSRTVFSEAMMLRKRREAVEGKLRAVLQQQRTQQRITENSLKVRQIHSDVAGPPRRSELPNRRRTHWDRLLREMNWMAVDFIEERKWKTSTGRTLSLALRSSDFVLAKQSVKTSAVEPATIAETEDVGVQHNGGKRKYSPNPLEEPRYVMPSIEELRQAKKVSSLISAMVSELALAMNESQNTTNVETSATNAERSNGDALDRYKKARIKLLDDTNLMPSESNIDAVALSSPESDHQHGDKASEDHIVNGHKPDTNEIPFPVISERLQSLGRLKRKKETLSLKEFSHATKSKGFSLSEDQLKIVEFVDQAWGSSIGAGLSGMPTSGKTVATCSVLWMNRGRGPQLVVCPAASSLRWKYELCMFHELLVVSFGQSGGISCSLKNSTNEITVGASDVVICDYASVGKLLGVATKKNIVFQTLCVDCRHPVGMFGSLQSQVVLPNRRSEWHGYAELLSAEWWEMLIRLENPRRLTIDYCDPDLYSLERSGLNRRRQLEILALRAALVLGAENFRPSPYSLQRTIISWARQQEKKVGEDKCERVARVLQARLARCSHTTNASLAISFDNWQIRNCEMSAAQQLAYKNCCTYLRGALSSTLGRMNTRDSLESGGHAAVVAALFRLRQICLGASCLPSEATAEIVSLTRENGRSPLNPTCRGSLNISLDKGSQPNVHVAELLLSNSGKLSELVSTLRHDCGIQFDCDPSLIPSRKGSAVKASLRVAILASLPRTQIILSTLLGALGISHQILRRAIPPDLNNSLSDGSEDDVKLTEVAWAETQISLLAFNVDENIRNKFRLFASPDIIILSPDSLASWHGGIGIDRADVVISIDEDWSGREMGTIRSAMARWTASRTLKNVSTRMIKLIAKDTIEQALCLYREDANSAWPFDVSGNHLLSLEREHILPLYRDALGDARSSCRLPGLGIIKMRGVPLEDVLGPSCRLAPFIDGSKMKFLPTSEIGRSDADLRKGLDLLHTLHHVETLEVSKAGTSVFQDIDRTSGGLPQEQLIGSGSPIVSPVMLVSNSTISSSDMPFLRARIFMARQVISLSSSPAIQRIFLAQVSDSGDRSSMPSKDSTGPGGSHLVGSTPNEIAECFLSYQKSCLPANCNETMSSTRLNSYSQVFSTTCRSTSFPDGSQGYEPLIFFPPVFPKVQVAPKAKSIGNPLSVEGLVGAAKDDQLGVPFESKVTDLKRRDVEKLDALTEPESKRPRVDPISSDISMPDAAFATSTVGEACVNQAKPPTAATKSELSELEVPTEDDYGLLGGGALPVPAQLAFLMATEAVQANRRYDTFLNRAAPCDNEEKSALSSGNPGQSLALISLFTKKRQRTTLHRPQAASPTNLKPNSAAGSSSNRDVNVEDPAKKIKKKVVSPPLQSAFTLLPVPGQNRPGIVAGTFTSNGKDEPKHRMHAAYVSRLYGTGLTMFESASFRIASMRVHNRVKARIDQGLLKVSLSDGTGSGLPASTLNRSQLIADVEQGIIYYAPVVQTLNVGSDTGDVARRMALAQASALARQQASPSRVDFGPFGSGFLSSTSELAGLSPTRSRLGVSLPIGVKLASSGQDHKQAKWATEEDLLLQEAVIRFGLNWTLVARALSGHQGFLIGSDGEDIIRRMAASSRSSRQCRDRWNSLLRTRPSLTDEVHKAETMRRESYLSRPYARMKQVQADTASLESIQRATDDTSLTLVIPSSMVAEDEKMDVDDVRPVVADHSPREDHKNSFARIKASMVKRQTVTLMLPGIPPGGQPIQPVPSHPSHIQSVQSSVAAQWSNGRTELWPLQILDCADKHRATTLPPGPRSNDTKSTPTGGSIEATSSGRASGGGGTVVVSTTSTNNAVSNASVVARTHQRSTAAPPPGGAGSSHGGHGGGGGPTRKTPNAPSNNSSTS